MNLLALAFSPVHPSRGFDPGFAMCASLVGLGGIVYASRMILYPAVHYEKLWDRLHRLENGYYNHLTQAKREARILALRIHVGAPDPIKRTKQTGYKILALVLLFELMVWGGMLFGQTVR